MISAGPGANGEPRACPAVGSAGGRSGTTGRGRSGTAWTACCSSGVDSDRRQGSTRVAATPCADRSSRRPVCWLRSDRAGLDGGARIRSPARPRLDAREKKSVATHGPVRARRCGGESAAAVPGAETGGGETGAGVRVGNGEGRQSRGRARARRRGGLAAPLLGLGFLNLDHAL